LEFGDDYFIDMSETELLQAFRKNRSEEAFTQLVHRYAGLVYSVAKRRLANATLAEDITQIVFIRFAKAPPNVNSAAELAAWLHRITINVTIDTWRSEIRRANREQQAVAMEPTTHENIVWEDISSKLDAALDQLNDEDRQALLLRFFRQKTLRDVGALLGVSEDAAKMRVIRAVDRLRTKLAVGSTACSATVLGILLTEHSLEAAPSHLVSRLANMKLPMAAGMFGVGGLLSPFMQISKFNLAIGAVVLTVIGVSIVRLVQSLNAPVQNEVVPSLQTNLTDNATSVTERARPNPSGFAAPSVPATLSQRPVKILFHVLDAETGFGLANAKIHAAFFGPGGMGESHDMLTDDNGIAAIPEPDDATKYSGPNVFVVAEGHVPKVVGFHNGTLPADYTMKLDPAMTVGGLVANERGEPVPDVKIFIQGPGNKPGQIENVDFQTCPVTSQTDGSWSCSYIPQDYTNEIRFILKNPGYAVTFPIVPVPQVNLTNLMLVLDRGFTVIGQITDSQTRPVAHARINTISGDPNRRLSAKSDQAGLFTLNGIPGDVANGAFYRGSVLATNDHGQAIVRGETGRGPLHVELTVQADGFTPQTGFIELNDVTNIADVTLSPGNIFRGHVIDETGNPVARVVVQTDFDFKNQIQKRFNWNSKTDGNGRFEWNSAPAEEICYWFETAGYDVIRGMPLKADGSDHVIILKRKASN
jgi:RNA polymerase sigma factor (sigma-70 family)